MREFIIVEVDGNKYAGTITAYTKQDATEFLINQLVESNEIDPTNDNYLCIDDDDEINYDVGIFVNNNLAYTITEK